jgi:hypothetical protein
VSGPPRPQRRTTDHWHPEYWTHDEHNRFDDRMARELEKLEGAIGALTTRVTLMLGGLTLVAILLPVIAPFVRAWLNVDTPTGQ